MTVIACTGCSRLLPGTGLTGHRPLRCPHCSKLLTPPPRDGSTGTTGHTAAVDALPITSIVAPAGATAEHAVAEHAAIVVSSPAPDSVLSWLGTRDTPPKPVHSFLEAPRAEGELGRLGPYRILSILGRGGMGVVFAAEDVMLKRPVALKAMLPAIADVPANRQRFLREAQAAAALEHEHIIAIYHVGEATVPGFGGVPYLTMPLLQGESLHERLQRERILPVAEVLRIGREVAEGLAAAHAHGVIHRDIKPPNIFLKMTHVGRPSTRKLPVSGSVGGLVKILDFGLARVNSSVDVLTKMGAILGTPAYMAPEQAYGEPVDARSDLFSLGCVLYHSATGQRPFRSDDLSTFLRAMAEDEPQNPTRLNPAVPPELARLMLWLLSKKAADRPESAEVVVEAIEAIEAGVTPQLPAEKRPGTQPTTLAKPGVIGEREPTAVPRRGLFNDLFQSFRGLFAPQAPSPEPPAATADLTPVMGSATLRLHLDPLDALVFLNDEAVLPTAENGFFVVQLSLGAQRVGVRRHGYQPFEQVVQVAAGGVEELRVALARLPEAESSIATMASEPCPRDRDALEWVLKHGGVVEVRIPTQMEKITIESLTAVPTTPFELLGIRLVDRGEVGKGDLALLQGLSSLMELNLTGTAVGDDDLTQLASLPRLRSLTLDQTAVTDAGVVHIAGLVKLETLKLANTALTDACVEHLLGLSGLRVLCLRGTKLTALGLSRLRHRLDGCEVVR